MMRAADGGEDLDSAIVETLGELRLLSCEGDDLNGAGGRDDGSWLRAILTEEVAEVIVVHVDDGDEPVFAHAFLDAGDTVVADIQARAPV